MRVECDERGGFRVITLTGDLDIESCTAVRSALIDAIDGIGERGRVIVDLTALDFMDSTGLGLLVSAHRRAAERGGELRFVQPSTSVQRLFHVTGLDDVLAFHPSAQAAADATQLLDTP
jgi:anti-sigma B factor antagonist